MVQKGLWTYLDHSNEGREFPSSALGFVHASKQKDKKEKEGEREGGRRE